MVKVRWFEAATDLSEEGLNGFSLRKKCSNKLELERILGLGKRKATSFTGNNLYEVEEDG